MMRRQAGHQSWGRCFGARPCRRLRCCRGSGRRCRGWWSAGRRPRSQNYRWSPQIATMPNPCVGICVSVSRVPTGTMEGWRLPATHRGGVAAAPSSVRPAAWKGDGNRNKLFRWEHIFDYCGRCLLRGFTSSCPERNTIRSSGGGNNK